MSGYAHVGNGSKTEVSGLARHVRFTLRSRHRQPASASPFGAKRRHRRPREKWKRPPTEAAYFIVNWKTDSPKRILGACQNPPWVIIDPVNAARFYDRSEHIAEAREISSFECAVCGETIENWNSAWVPRYRFIACPARDAE